jgi:hypothetical protein
LKAFEYAKESFGDCGLRSPESGREEIKALYSDEPGKINQEDTAHGGFRKHVQDYSFIFRDWVGRHVEILELTIQALDTMIGRRSTSICDGKTRIKWQCVSL